MRQDEFRERYLIKVGSSIIIAVLNAIIQFLLPRALSVEEYGYYTYNLNIFTSIVAIATLSAPNALVAKFSKRNEEIGIVTFYLKFYCVTAALLNLVILLLYRLQFGLDSFAGQTFFVVMLALETSLILRLQTDSICVFDAMAISRYPAIMQILLKVIMCVIVVGGYLLHRLNLALFYISQSIVTLVIVLIMISAIIREQHHRYAVKVDKGVPAYLKEYFAYCKPLILSTVFSQIVVVLMNWALMNWSGAAETAMFGAAWQLNTLVSYVFAPYAELSKREFAIACRDRKQLRYHYEQALRFVFWMTAYFALFIGFTAPWILPLVFGDNYSGAALVTLLIMLYTVYQAWGQIAGSFFLATEKTKISAAFSIAGQVLTLAMVFLFQIPNFIWPQGLGATGIALTYLVSNVLLVCAQIYVISGIIESPFLDNIRIQFFPLFYCGGLSFALYRVMDRLVPGDAAMTLVGKFVTSSVIYTTAVGLVIWFRPELIGLSRDGLKAMLRRRGGEK